MNRKLHSSSSEKENIPRNAISKPHIDQVVSISNTTPIHDSTSTFISTQHSKRHCRSTTNSFVRHFGVNLFRQFEATIVETYNSALTPPQATT